VIVVTTIAILSRPDVPRNAPLWADEFDVASDAWTIDAHSAFIQDGRLAIHPTLSGPHAIALHPLTVTHFVAETNASAQGAIDNAYGILVGAGDELTAFVISSDGYVGVMQRSVGQWRDQHPWRQWPHVQRGTAANRLRLACVETICRFYVNGEITFEVAVGTQRDAIGLIASRYTKEIVRVGFDYLRIWRVQP
jgi:hypothetical protein